MPNPAGNSGWFISLLFLSMFVSMCNSVLGDGGNGPDSEVSEDVRLQDASNQPTIIIRKKTSIVYKIAASKIAGFGTQTALTPQRTALSVSHFGFEVHVSNFKSKFLRAQTIFLLAVFFGAEDTDLKMRFPGVLVPKSSGDRLDHQKMLQGRNSIKKVSARHSTHMD